MRISHDRAAAIVIAMFEAGVEGAETLLQYVEEQSSHAELTDRELALRALRRAEEAVVPPQNSIPVRYKIQQSSSSH